MAEDGGGGGGSEAAKGRFLRCRAAAERLARVRAIAAESAALEARLVGGGGGAAALRAFVHERERLRAEHAALRGELTALARALRVADPERAVLEAAAAGAAAATAPPSRPAPRPRC